jgi:hypothetical protein
MGCTYTKISSEENYILELTNYLFSQMYSTLLHNHTIGIEPYHVQYIYEFNHAAEMIIKKYESHLNFFLSGFIFRVYKPADSHWYIVVKWSWVPDYVVPETAVHEFQDIIKDMAKRCSAQHELNSATIPTEQIS